MVIYKYPLELTDYQTLALPRDAEILSVQIQRGRLCLWAYVEPSYPTSIRRFVILGTGQPDTCAEKLRHLDTVQDDRGGVWHVFEAVPWGDRRPA